MAYNALEYIFAALLDAPHILSAIYRDIEVLREDGMDEHAIVVSLLLSSVKLASCSRCVRPTALRHMFDAVMNRRFAVEDGEPE
jgi:hypothetical protein